MGEKETEKNILALVIWWVADWISASWIDSPEGDI